ncbi:putative ATP-sulfurylase [Emiliania huxleyi CCMP1516]|uniref:sulfate adenylyltransferase n=2 Tax=Emiliania huxleyi TaxID=2903 RepID=A0A0D3JY71_EMIH1|nr:putative ATP-sulfurylase [Emiliania huxleyi CCMP1516]XP_005780885.1 putative ATP-sulfurylase [Emiliania huxleyi CCMP1516]EOD11740.1 putative ATP-sulfurylase [Emiliania huxleyi CCMP1516]EOD28456.1 putative ATP-sulfurylase [Emiliania huxleyi CCMP1516]|eukprot:XP_005764169.1 putative ATP-sulfurylase [Emiliania huxleyi CCMP1516]
MLSLALTLPAFLPGQGMGMRRGVASGVTMAAKQTPHGGTLVDLFSSDAAAAAASADIKVELTDRQSCDVELLCNGGFSPLTGFMNEAEYNSVVEDMKLPSGLIFGLPVVMDTGDANVKVGSKLLLTYQGTDMAVMTVESLFTPDKPKECLNCYGTASIEHPGVRMVAMERGSTYVGGPLQGLGVPTRDFPCATPKEVRETLPDGADVVAFQCRNPVHRAHYELFTRALDAPNVGEDAVVLVHPTCGPTQEEDIPGSVRHKTYVVLQDETKDTPSGKRTRWAFLPYSMHMAGPREAIHHMMIRKNFGCTHFIIGRDMAGSKSSVTGDDFYGAFEAQDLAKARADELGVQAVPSLNLVCDPDGNYITADEAKEKGIEVMKLSGTKFRKMLRAGEEIPEWFAFKSVVDVLRAEWK